MAGIFAQTVVFGAHVHRRQPRRGPAEGAHRPVPVAADGAVGGAGRPHGRRPRRSTSSSIVVMALTGLLVGWRIHTSVLRGARRLPAAAGVRLRDLVGDGAGRAAGADARGGQQRELHRDLPADVHREHLRADRQLPAGAARRSRSGTRCPRCRRPPASCSATPCPALPAPDVWSLQNPVLYSLHLGRGDPGGLRAAVGAHLPAHRQPLSGPLLGCRSRSRSPAGPRRAGATPRERQDGPR